MTPQEQIEQLNQRVGVLENTLAGKGAINQFEELVRNIIMFDVDNSSAVTRGAVDSGGDTVTVPVNPTKYAKVYFRGQVFNVALYAIA